MVAITIRMQYLRGKLATIRCGKGAAIMAPGVKRIALEFPFKNHNGAMGPRKFWQKYMPTLKYHNPDVQMDVHRSSDPMTPSTLTIEFDGDRKEVLNSPHLKKTPHSCETAEKEAKRTGAGKSPLMS
ncbi:uncharacterized protein H6S33_000339 [Morchella sextelata]|uniref:uncharacterized protein n=1 Tax=Morchella sextelata TaxID=1174677 RepID=UPI001D039A6B|nr:uncharacterized protein H6S33_000339 [Morchella sextelata]KAH0614703.1 hypothetical protein H6S33_000339 [Morchella sextelata]